MAAFGRRERLGARRLGDGGGVGMASVGPRGGDVVPPWREGASGGTGGTPSSPHKGQQSCASKGTRRQSGRVSIKRTRRWQDTWRHWRNRHGVAVPECRGVLRAVAVAVAGRPAARGCRRCVACVSSDARDVRCSGHGGAHRLQLCVPQRVAAGRSGAGAEAQVQEAAARPPQRQAQLPGGGGLTEDEVLQGRARKGLRWDVCEAAPRRSSVEQRPAITIRNTHNSQLQDQHSHDALHCSFCAIRLALTHHPPPTRSVRLSPTKSSPDPVKKA